MCSRKPDELQFLWSRRQAVVRSPKYTLRALADLDERVAARADGLVIGGRHAAPLLRKGMAAEEPVALFAAAYPLLAMGKEKITQRILEKFLQAKGTRLDGLRQVFCHVSISSVRPQLQQALASAPDAVAVAVTEILAAHSLLDFTTSQFERFLKHADPAIRRLGWRSVSMSLPVRSEVYEAGFRDADAAVRDEARLAAAWGRQQLILEHCRKLAAQPTPEHLSALRLLAILGKPEDCSRIQAISQAVVLGPERFQILGAFGNPNLVESLLPAMDSKEPLTAVAAGAAFTKITGADINSRRKAPVSSADGSEPTAFEKEFLDEVTLPDAERACSHWQKVKAQFQKCTRWCRGVDLTQGGSLAEWDQLDLESRWEAQLRGKFLGVWKANPFELEKFPQTHAYSPPKK